MIFSRDLFPKVMSGDKTMTRRPKHGRDEHCPVAVRGTFSVQPGRGKYHRAHAVDAVVRHERLGAISEADAQREGFPSRAAFLDGWRVIYGGLDLEEWVCVVEWVTVEVLACCAADESGVAA